MAPRLLSNSQENNPMDQEKNTMRKQFELMRQDPKGRVAVPMLLWLAGAPLGVVLLVWLFFFRGH